MLKIAAEGAQSKADADKSDKSDKAADANSGKAKEESNGAKKDDDSTAETSAKPAAEASAEKPKPKYPPYAEFLKDTQKIEGLLTLHRKDDTLYAEIGPRQLDRDFIVLITIARGIGQAPLLGGISWGFGDDAVWQFRKAGENIQLVRRNVRFTADHGSPTEKAVKIAYTDSVLFSLPIRTTSPSGALRRRSDAGVHERPAANRLRAAGLLVLVEQVDLGEHRRAAEERRARSRGHVRLERHEQHRLGARYAWRHGQRSLFDQRVAANVYHPRLADDRVGYFLTALKDYSKKEDEDDRFVRYINRWNLEKAEPSAEMSRAEGADYLLAREDDSVPISQADSRRHFGMEQSLREGRLLRRD